MPRYEVTAHVIVEADDPEEAAGRVFFRLTTFAGLEVHSVLLPTEDDVIEDDDEEVE